MFIFHATTVLFTLCASDHEKRNLHEKVLLDLLCFAIWCHLVNFSVCSLVNIMNVIELDFILVTYTFF